MENKTTPTPGPQRPALKRSNGTTNLFETLTPQEIEELMMMGARRADGLSVELKITYISLLDGDDVLDTLSPFDGQPCPGAPGRKSGRQSRLSHPRPKSRRSQHPR